MNFIDLFSGIGGFRLGMERAGHICLGHVEIDKFANKSYEAIFRKGDLIGTDITTISNKKWREYRGKVDCICGGFPCQAFSIAGNRRGFEDTRGTLFFEILRAAKEIQPSYLFLENVKGLLSHDKGKTFEVMLQALDELGYDVEWKVLNSKNFGIPQNRERVFIIGHLRGRSTSKVFFIGGNDTKAIETQRQEITTNTLTTRYPESQGVGSWVIENRKPKVIGNIIPVLTPDRLEKRQNGRRFKENGEPAFTLTAQDRHGIIIQVGNISNGSSFGGNSQIGRIYSTEGIEPCLNTMQGGGREPKILIDEIQIRKLTPRECWRLQGFPDWAFDRAGKANSDSQLYKQAGNSVTVNVIEWIANRLKIWR